MIYLSEFHFPGEDREWSFFAGSSAPATTATIRSSCSRRAGLRALELADVTILYGGNGSGKTTALNVMARNAAPAAVHAVQHDELLPRLLPPVQRALAARTAGAQLHFDQRRRV